LAWLSRWTRVPRNLTAAFLAVAAVSVVALIWLGVRLVAQDRALETERLRERRESAADRVVAALDQALSADERSLAGLSLKAPDPGTPGLALVVSEAGELRVLPATGLPYYPVTAPLQEAAPGVFRAAERLEFRDRDFDRAIEVLRPVSLSRDLAIQAGAQLRLARNLRKAGRPEAALKAYGDLAGNSGVAVAGAPADLVARHARCALLQDLGRGEDVRESVGVSLRAGAAPRVSGGFGGLAWRGGGARGCCWASQLCRGPGATRAGGDDLAPGRHTTACGLAPQSRRCWLGRVRSLGDHGVELSSLVIDGGRIAALVVAARPRVG
jgi:hypothetical protein